MGMKVSWPKTKVQCFGVPSPPAPGIVVQGQPVEQVDQFCYLGSSIDSTGRCKPEVMRRIGIASSSMNSLTRVWAQASLSLAAKLRIYETCIMPILLYGSETWTLLKADSDRLQAFHMRAQRRLLGVKWYDMVRNVDITQRTGLPPISIIIDRRRLALFGHVARLAEDVPANRLLWTAIQLRTGHPPSPSWRRPPGRPRDSWIKPLMQPGSSIHELWEREIGRGHGLLAQRLPPDK